MGTIFLGSELMTVDDKGRVGIPARHMAVLRALCPDRCAEVGIHLDPDGAIKVLPMPAFDKFMDGLDQLNDQIEEERLLLTMYSSFADTLELDKQNRIRLSASILDECKIARPGQVMITGSRDHLRIFDMAAWREYCDKGKAQMNSASSKFAKKDEAKPAITQYVINAPGEAPAAGAPAR